MAILSLLSLALSFLAGISYLPVSKMPRVRRTMWPTWVLFVLSALLAFASVATGKLDGFAIAALALFAFFVISYMLVLRVPVVAGRPQVGKPIPSFEVMSESGRLISPDHYAGKGPLLLVFFRGFW